MAAFRLRSLTRNIHLWIGLCLIIVFIPLGLSGSFMVFEDDFNRMLHPQRYHASAGDTELAPSKYFAAAQQAFGAKTPVSQLRMPEDEGAPTVVTGAGGATAWVDPASGKVLDVGNPRKELSAVAHQFHEGLFMGRAGRRVVGWIGLGMFLMSVTGLITWWPRGAFLKGLKWRRSPLVWSNLHHLVGFWSSAFLVILSLTGMALAFPELLQPARAPARMARAEGGPPRFFFAPPIAAPHLTADQAVGAAEKAAGALDFQSVFVPTQGGPPNWQVVVLGPNGPAFMSSTIRQARRAFPPAAAGASDSVAASGAASAGSDGRR